MPEIRQTLTADASGVIKSYKQVEAGLEGIDKAAKKSQGTIDETGKKMQAAFGPIGGYIEKLGGMNTPALAAAAGLGALITASVAFSKAVIDATRDAIAFGGKLADLSAKTGISAEGLQKLTHAGRLTGASTEQLSSAVTKMQLSLVNGSKGIEALGLSQQRLLAMKPEAAFSEIAAAIKKIEDPALQAAAAVQIFGKSGAEMLPALKSSLGDAAKEAEHLGLVLSDETVAALDAVGDSVDTMGATWEAAWRNVGATIAKQPEFIAALKGITEGLGAIARAAPAATQGMLGFFGAIDKFILGGNGNQLLTILGAMGRLMGAAPDVKTPLFGPMDAPAGPKIPPIAAAIELATKNTREWERALKKAADEAERIAKSLSTYRYNPNNYVIPAGGIQRTPFNDVLQNIPEMKGGRAVGGSLISPQAGAATAKVLMDAFSSSLAKLPGVILAAIQGGGNVGQAIGASLGADVGKFLGEKLGKHLGQNAGKIFGPLGEIAGSLLGALIGKGIGKLLGGLFGGEGRKVNDLRDAFVSAAGGITELDRRAQAAGLTIDRMLNARTVKEYEAAIRELNDAFDLQTEAQEKLDATIEKYGFTIEELGPKWAAQKLNEKAMELFQDYHLLIGAGIDYNTVIARMGPAINEWFNTALRAGVAIPEAWRGIIERMIENRQLLDENGKAYESLEATGITFTDSMEAQFRKLLDAIQRLVNALNGIPDIDRRVTVTTYHRDGGQVPQDPLNPSPTNPNQDPSQGGLYGWNDDGTPDNDGYKGNSYAFGGIARGPMSGYRATLHGREAVIPLDRPSQIGNAMLGGGELLREMRGIRAELRQLPNLIRDAQQQMP